MMRSYNAAPVNTIVLHTAYTVLSMHLMTVSQTLETENSYYMAMELCAGGDLMDRICDRKRLEEKEVRRYTRQILSAVEHLHQHGIVHR